ncbi:hypothetical protein OG249_37840 [Streptomyces microflavus]|uniref:hypothetical protein n=1 Tax=Streptomyces microflavus TaxID=1919 RepID=UPI0022555316|nr:hypothetical protein [Streptomyces microflavus]MCX4657620.1 hypothetical protein [Streptomyces microflavus]
MQMNETFAATIAAVVPVIWLVGALEAHQVMKFYLASSQRLEETARVGERLLKEAGAEPTAERIGALQKEMGDRLDDGVEEQKTFPPASLFAFWVIFGTILLTAEWQSLQWLAEGGPGPRPGLAKFLLSSTIAGFGAIIVVPSGVTIAQTMRHLRRGKRRHAALREATIRRVQALQREPEGEQL